MSVQDERHEAWARRSGDALTIDELELQLKLLRQPFQVRVWGLKGLIAEAHIDPSQDRFVHHFGVPVHNPLVSWELRRGAYDELPEPGHVVSVPIDGAMRLMHVQSVEWPSLEVGLAPLGTVLARSLIVGEDERTLHELLLEAGWTPPPDF